VEAHIVDGMDFATAGAENGLEVPDIKDGRGRFGHSVLPATFLSLVIVG